MNNFVKIFLLIALLMIGSCTFGVSGILWEKPLIGADVESFFLDKENNRVVLVGSKNPNTNLAMHYSITDKSNTIIKVFEIGQKSESGVLPSFYGSTIRGSGVDRVWIAFGMNRLSEEDKKFLDEFNESPGKKKYGDFGYYASKNNGSKITRYPSSKEKFKNICSQTNKDQNCSPIIKLKKPWQGPVNNAETWPSLFGKLALTPLTLAADTLLAPLNVLTFFMANKPHK